MVHRLIAIALLYLPEPVVLPSQHMVRVRLQRALVPDLRLLVVAELAVGVADQVGDIGIVVMVERPELADRAFVIVAVVDRRIGLSIALDERGIAEQGLLGRLLGPMGRTV